MDYHAFYQDVIKWMDANNQMIAKYTIQGDQYWNWVIQTSGYMCNKYGNHPLVIKQMAMFLDYLETSYKEVTQCRKTV